MTNTRKSLLSVKEIKDAASNAVKTARDVWLTDPAPRGKGRLVVRCTAAGSSILMFRYTAPDGSRQIVNIGAYDPAGRSGLTLEQARDAAGALTKKYQRGSGNLRADLSDEKTAKEAAKAKEAKSVEDAQRKAQRGSLSALIDAYIKTLEGRQSAYDARNILALHVTAAFPDIATLPAAAIEAEQLRDVLARLIDAGKGRTAAKLRAYLRAAYGLAMRAGLDPTVPETLTEFDVRHNPLERLPSLSQFSKALDRALSLPELVSFWKRVQKAPPGPPRDALIACILLGGQRPTQMLRVTAADVDLSGKTLTLRDIKGRNRHGNPRRHVLPIPVALLTIVQSRREACETLDAPLFGTTNIKTVTDLVGAICADMAEAGELERGPFQLRDLRRTAETHMAAMGISSDVRAQIQSHGLGGIQARHYDRHDYMEEKRAALALWAARLKSKPAAKARKAKS